VNMPRRIYGLAAIVVLAGTLFGQAPITTPAFAQDACERPACVDSDYREGYCHSRPSWPLNYRSHWQATCAAGETLNAATGMCRRRDCGGGCEERVLCSDARWPNYSSGSGGRDARGAFGTCNSNPAPFTGALSHTRIYCAAGFDLDGARGVCRRCPSTAPLPAPPGPDLIIREAWLRTTAAPARTTTLRRGQAYLACFTVANVGTAPSPGFRVGGGGLGVPVAPFQDHVGLAVGASRTGCITYPTTPPPGAYNLGLEADSRHVVPELNEGNNTATLRVTVTP
jgi:hypothetical protein